MNETKLYLQEEQLSLFKRWVQTGEVCIRKEIIIDEKNIVVPVTREELVIEKRVPGGENTENTRGGENIIRIPISEERVEIIKHRVVLENVSIYRHQFQELQHIEEMLKKEEIHINTTGEAEVIDINMKNKS